jgi:hypothetical protein
VLQPGGVIALLRIIRRSFTCKIHHKQIKEHIIYFLFRPISEFQVARYLLNWLTVYLVFGTFFDSATNILLKNIGPITLKSLDPRQSTTFDIDTGYTSKQANQFQHMMLQLQ